MKAFLLLDDLAKDIPDNSAISPELAVAITDLSNTFQEIILSISLMRKKKFFARLIHVKSYKSQMTIFTKRLDDAIEFFKIRSQVRVEIAIQKLTNASHLAGECPVPHSRPTFRAGYFPC